MTDRAVEIIKSLHAHAAEHGAVVDRIEVTLHDGGNVVGFTAHMSPKPLASTTAALGYSVGSE